jgi:hypothetical protein
MGGGSMYKAKKAAIRLPIWQSGCPQANFKINTAQTNRDLFAEMK